MSDNSTISSKVKSGKKVFVIAHQSSNTTIAHSIESNVIKLTHGSHSQFDSGYRKVNYSEQKERDAYRKVNKMLGGY